MDDFETLRITVNDHIAHVELNRPEKANAMNRAFWSECRQAFEHIDESDDARVVVISAKGKHFSAGIDLELLADLNGGLKHDDPARRVDSLRRLILDFQGAFTAIERCRKPVLAAIHGGCIGGGVDMVSACDMRYCTVNARFQIMEIDIGLTADVGTLQRLPHIIGDGMMRELAYTGRAVKGPEAREIGLVNQVFEDHAQLLDGVMDIARQIASKSPLAIRGTKEMILYARDHSVADGLNYVATWNAGMISEADLREAMAAQQAQRPPAFGD